MQAFYSILCLIAVAFAALPAHACGHASERDCIKKAIEAELPKIDNTSWRDIRTRELAKTYAHDGQAEQAIALIDTIKDPDTKAMTIRGIGMEVAKSAMAIEAKKDIFKTLKTVAPKIEHPPSHDIAITYIAMAEAYAAFYEDALATAQLLTNSSLKNKALGETAEIMAEKKQPALISAAYDKMDSDAYRDKSKEVVCKLLNDNGMADEALQLAQGIKNPLLKTTALQHIILPEAPTSRKAKQP